MDLEELTRMAVFARVVEESSFSEAARVLGLAKSTASKHVAELEARLGVRLLHRTTRRLVVTEAGRELYARCAGLVAQAQEALRAVAELQSEPRGVLRVYAQSSFGRLYLSPVLPEFLARYPEVEMELVYVDRPVDVVRERIDVAVHLAQPGDGSLVVRRLGTSRRFVCGAPEYLAAQGEPRTPEELQQHVCLVYAEEGVPVPWRLRGPGGEVAVKLRGRVRASNSEALMELMLAGVGLGYPPSFASAAHIRAGRLRPVLTAWSEEMVPLYLAWPPGRNQDPKVRAFLDYLVERLGHDAQWEPELAPTVGEVSPVAAARPPASRRRRTQR